MAPEQAAGLVDQIDFLTDVYGLGAVLFQILTDRPPVTGMNSNDVIHKTLEEPLTPPRQLNPSIPRPLEAICLKALTRERSERYPSALELAAEVKRWLGDESV